MVRNYYLAGQHDVIVGIDEYQRTAPLIIDPVLNFSTYLGGGSYDSIQAIATDAAGNVYLVGETISGNLASASAPSRPSRDAFVAKMNSAGTQLLYISYLGAVEMIAEKGLP